MVTQPWTINQLLKLRRYQPEMVDQAIEAVLAQSKALQWAIILGAYLDEEISLAKAAELLNLHRLELQERFIIQGIPLRLGASTIAEARAELTAIEAWNTTVEESV